MLHIHALLWLINAPNSNELLQQIKIDEAFKHNLMKYLDDILVQSLITKISTYCKEINSLIGILQIHVQQCHQIQIMVTLVHGLHSKVIH
jgi:hypothetical protein